MAYGDYSGADKPNKGHEGGACNRQRCQAEPADFYNHGSYSWYCVDCARDIGEDVVNKRGWDLEWRPRLGHAMFETRAAMDARAEQQAKAKVDAEASRRHAPPEFEQFFGHGVPKKAKSASLERLLSQNRRAPTRR